MVQISDQALQSLDDLLVGTGTKKLEAEDYSTEDLDGVTEGAFGSGNLNYLLLQQQQTNELQSIIQTKILSDSALSNGSLSAMPVGADDLRPNGDDAAFANTFGDAIDKGRADAIKAADSAAAQAAAGTGQGLGAAAVATTSFVAADAVAQRVNLTSDLSTSDRLTGLDGSDGAAGTGGQNGSNGTDGTDGTDGGGGDGGDHDPFIHIDVDLSSGDQLVETVNNVVNQAGDIINTLLTEGPGPVVTQVTDTVNDLLDDVLQTVGGVTDNLQNVLAGDLSIANLLDTLPLNTVLGPDGLDLNAIIRDTADLNLNLTDALNLTTDLNLLETGVPLVDNLLSTADQIGDLNLDIGNIVDNVDSLVAGLTSGLLGSPTDGDTDLGLNLGVGDLSVAENVLLDPVEALVGDIDIGVNLDLNSGDLGLDNLVTIDSDNALIDGVGDVAENALGAVDGVVGGVTDGLADGVGDLLEGGLTPDTVVAAVDDVVGGVVDGLGGLLGGGAEGDTDLGLNLGGEALDIPLDPVEALVGDVDIGVNLDLSDGDLGLDNLVNIDSDNALIDGVGNVAEDALSSVDGAVDTVTDTVGDVLSGDVNPDEVLAAAGDAVGDVTDTLTGGVTDLLGVGGGSDGDTDLGLNLGGEAIDIPLDPVEALVGDVDVGVNLDLSDGDLGLDNLVSIDSDNALIDGVGDVAEDALSGVDGTVDDVADTVSDVLSGDVNPDDVLAAAGDVVGDVTDTLTDGLGDLLGGDSTDGDTDLGLNLGGEALDIPLDPVEALVGDVDVGVNLDLGSGDLGLGDIIAVDADNSLLDNTGSVVDDILSSADNLLDLAPLEGGDSGGLGDLDLSDTLGLDDSLGGALDGLLNNPLPEPTGSVDEGMSVVSDIHDKVLGGVFGLF
ncbi:MAG: hypothetical protein GC134_07150 [Proteobacteria bacterium]|nr:hypothetical protein [Pseudomonadota bacterium]